MADFHLRLITLLGILTMITVAGLALDYWQLIRRPARTGLFVASAAILAGFILTVHAVLPGNHLYGEVFSGVRTEQKIVALTFDDGPYLPYTVQLLDLLKECQVQATFFVIGQNAAKHPELIRRMAAEGHQLGNHTWSHTDLLKVDRMAMIREVERTSRLLEQLTGSRPAVVRPPHGFRDPLVMEVMADRGLTVIEWSAMARDWTNPGVDVIVRTIVSEVVNGSVILLHDGDGVQQEASRAQTIEATRQIIRELTSRGYRFVTVKEMLKSGRSK